MIEMGFFQACKPEVWSLSHWSRIKMAVGLHSLGRLWGDVPSLSVQLLGLWHSSAYGCISPSSASTIMSLYLSLLSVSFLCLSFRLTLVIAFRAHQVNPDNLPHWDPSVQFSSVQLLSCVRLFATPWIAARQASCSSPSSRVHSDSCPLSLWCHPAISSSVIPFSSCPQSLPASESFPMSQLSTWGGQSTGASALASFLPKNTQDWSPSKWTGWISLQSKGLSRVFSNTTVQKHQFFSSQPSSQSNSHIHTWPLGKP